MKSFINWWIRWRFQVALALCCFDFAMSWIVPPQDRVFWLLNSSFFAVSAWLNRGDLNGK